MGEGLVDVTPGRRVFARVAVAKYPKLGGLNNTNEVFSRCFQRMFPRAEVAKYPKLGGLNTILSQLQRPEERN